MNSVLFTTTAQKDTKQLIGTFCLSCEMNFTTEQDHKIHYRSELHQYNLKRKMVNLPPISEDRFKKSLTGKLKRVQKYQKNKCYR